MTDAMITAKDKALAFKIARETVMMYSDAIVFIMQARRGWHDGILAFKTAIDFEKKMYEIARETSCRGYSPFTILEMAARAKQEKDKMNIIKFTIYGEPTAKGRARFRNFKTKSGKQFTTTYTPKKTRDAETDFKTQSLQFKPDLPLEGALLLGVKVYRSMPKSMSKKKKLLAISGELRPTVRPDLDNFIKLIKDSLNKIFWQDDSQVVEYLPGTGKYYSERSRIEIEIKKLENHD